MGNALKDLGIQPVRMMAAGVEPWGDSVVLRQQRVGWLRTKRKVCATRGARECYSAIDATIEVKGTSTGPIGCGP